MVNLFVFIFRTDKNCELIELINYHHFVLFFKLTSLLECAGEEPIEDIDIPVGGRYEDDFYINLLMAMIAMIAMMAILAMMAMMAILAILAMMAMIAMMAMMKTIVTTSKVNDRR